MLQNLDVYVDYGNILVLWFSRCYNSKVPSHICTSAPRCFAMVIFIRCRACQGAADRAGKNCAVKRLPFHLIAISMEEQHPSLAHQGILTVRARSRWLASGSSWPRERVEGVSLGSRRHTCIIKFAYAPASDASPPPVSIFRLFGHATRKENTVSKCGSLPPHDNGAKELVAAFLDKEKPGQDKVACPEAIRNNFLEDSKHLF